MVNPTAQPKILYFAGPGHSSSVMTEVDSWGGKVVLAEILDGYSTTETLRRIAE